jgi:hypothetical protein
VNSDGRANTSRVQKVLAIIDRDNYRQGEKKIRSIS